ncbi:hypothetical protein CCR85_12850 [Rhodothalassium salexigens]|uniref:Rieske (2Fe-2S) protein n=1 Tax=Rhodothalassium salexigens TaxID=1086 RepID=UPI001A91F50E|nr:Rieske (2Fe-2S) protein [Rhodothalassium salexigens]MBK5912374.1 hypothetical protein [Rhodothalassium salexigens]MBK5920112.1 hypothetical protein [Rhodothalassium salexigens]
MTRSPSPAPDPEPPQASANGFVVVLDADALGDRESRAVWVHGRAVLICRVGRRHFAVANRCPHAGRALAGGRLSQRPFGRPTLACPVHDARFDLTTGAVRSRLTQKRLETYPVRVVDGRVEVAVPPAHPEPMGDDA